MAFKLHTPYPPAGDQPDAIRNLTEGILDGEKYQTLLGVTGSGKTFTIANVIQNVQDRHWFLRIIKHWWLNFTVNSNNSSRKMLLDILFLITITINRKLICQ